MNDTVVFHGGTVLTMERRAATAVAISGGRVLAVGDDDLLLAHPDARPVDLAGRTLSPGFIDAHNHLSIAALHPMWADLSAVHNIDGLAAALHAHARANPDTAWIRGCMWTDLGHGFQPRRADLDALGLDRPIVVAHYSLHQGVVCSRGLAELGIGRTTPDPSGGQIARDAHGEPDGLLVERAWSEAHARSVAAYADPDRWADHVETRARQLLADGITCIHDAACSPEAEAMYAMLHRNGRLPISVVAMPHPAALLQPLDRGRLDGPPTGEGDEMLRVGAVKLFADGGVLPALDAHVGTYHVQVGELFDGLGEQITAVTERDFAVAVHAIGNGALRCVLEAFRGVRAPRMRVEHACLAGRDELAEMAAIGAIAVVQPGFVHHMGAEVEQARFDDATWLPFGDLDRAGVTIAASSDDPCTFHQPLRTAARGVNRVTAHGNVLDIAQGLSYERWLEAYTLGAATAAGQEHERGRIAPGLRADLVVIDGPLDADAPPRVAQTWLAGECVFDAQW